MSGGSSGGGSQPQDNSLALQQMQYQHDAELQAAADAKQAQLDADFKTNLSNAVTGAKGTGDSILSQRGLDPSTYDPVIQQAISDEQSKVPQGDPNPSQYFTSDLINNALTGYQGNTQARNSTTVNNRFASGFENQALPDSLTSPYINEILTTQQGQAKQALLAAQQRGQLTDTGLTAANAALDTQSTGAKSTLDALGAGVLGKDRSDLGNIKSTALSGANSWQLGDPNFSIDPYQTQFNDAVTKDQGNLGGDITNALGSTPLFNVNSILLSGAGAQGPQNLTTASVPGAPVKKSNIDRGLGSQGATF
jgi:hypothetical protein